MATHIPQHEARKRWETLPIRIREAVYSPENADILWTLCEKNNIPQDTTYDIATAIGNVMMGFVHHNQLESEIKSIIPAASQNLIDQIVLETESKILFPIRMDIERVYRPIAPPPPQPTQSQKPPEQQSTSSPT